jgi:DNA-binding NarL/FixJ family response regulator
VLVEIAQGLANPEMAQRLYLSEATVKTLLAQRADRAHVELAVA